MGIANRFAHALAQQPLEIRGATLETDARQIVQVFAADEFHAVIAQVRRFRGIEKRLGKTCGAQ